MLPETVGKRRDEHPKPVAGAGHEPGPRPEQGVGGAAELAAELRYYRQTARDGLYGRPRRDVEAVARKHLQLLRGEAVFEAAFLNTLYGPLFSDAATADQPKPTP